MFIHTLLLKLDQLRLQR